MKAKSANKEAASRIAQFRCLDDTTGGERGNEKLKDVPMMLKWEGRVFQIYSKLKWTVGGPRHLEKGSTTWCHLSASGHVSGTSLRGHKAVMS
jgi:hypothetical protein